VDELLSRAQQQVAQAKERLALLLERLYRRWKGSKQRKHSTLLYAFQAEANKQRRLLVEHSSAVKIQRVWRRYTAGNELAGRAESQAQIFLVEHFLSAQRRQTYLAVDLDHAARRIQAAYRCKLMRRFLRLLRARVLAPACASPIAELIAKCEARHQQGTERMTVVHSLDTLAEKRSLFDHPVLVLRGVRASSEPPPPTGGRSPLQHVVSAIQYSAVLKSLICAKGDFTGDRILTLLQSLQARRTLRVLALGEISTKAKTSSPNQDVDAAVEQSSGWSASEAGQRNTETSPSSPLNRRLLSLPSPPSSPQPHQKRQPSALQVLSQALCTSNFLLEELYFERNELLRRPQEGAIVAAIAADYFFARYGRLHTLVVAHMHFSDANGALLGAALAINTVLRTLDLHGNVLGDDAATAIANDGLAHNKSLRFLNLAENAIGSAGGNALFTCLSHHNRTLQTLILRNNLLLSDVVPVVIAAWQVNPVLETVELAGNLVNECDVTQLQLAATERREVSPSEDNHELRLLLARRRFGVRDARSPLSSGIGIFATPTSPGRSSAHQKKKPPKNKVPLSPKKWLSANTPKIISPIAFPTAANRQLSHVSPTAKWAAENVYTPARPRKLLKGPARQPSHSTLPELSATLGKKRLAW
jgi:hypothetical protein